MDDSNFTGAPERVALRTHAFDELRVGMRDSVSREVGEVDELNAWLGLVRASGLDADIDTALVHIQRDLFAVGAQLADPADRLASRVTKAFIADTDVERLEQLIDRLEQELPPLTRFILAGGNPAGASLHVARTVCRRAERRCVSLMRKEQVDSTSIIFLNRLSDALFVLARWVAHSLGESEVLWERTRVT